jgi:hypothetical protein
VEKSRSHEPAKNDGNERRGEKQGEENPEKESHLYRINVRNGAIVQ